MMNHLPEGVRPKLVNFFNVYERVFESENKVSLYYLQKQVQEKDLKFLRSRKNYRDRFEELSGGVEVKYEEHIEKGIEELKTSLLERIKDCDYCLLVSSALKEAVDIRLKELFGVFISKEERFNLGRKIDFLKKDLEFLSLDEGTIH